MDKKKIFQRYIDVAKVLGEMFAPVLETVVNDLSKPKHSIIAIFNGQVTGRKIGDGTTELGYRRIAKEDIPDLLINYTNESPDGRKLKCSSIAIRDENGKLLGSFCLNFDITYFSQMGTFLEQFITCTPNFFVSERDKFQGVPSPQEEIRNSVRSFLVKKNWQSRNNLAGFQKREVIRHLYREGHFNKRGAVTIVAKALAVTRPSVYSYLKEAA